ncbi:cohesin domain-containing protein [Cohnella fermenti]|uniref:cohesin domain-containing protein n=1 Tax=Cohnella fermenti TaxID=2565925 RepID=UPI001454DACD|nr:cohesin domain-containing protein [Cohnella fermenti]
MTAATMLISAASAMFTDRAQAAAAAALVTADWNTTYQEMDGVGASYAYTDSIMLMQIAQAGDQDTVRHLLDLMFSDTNGTGHDIVRVIIGSNGVTSAGASQSSPGFNPVTGLRADAAKPGYDVDGNLIPVKGTAGQYGYKIGTWNRIYDGQADSIWPNEPEHPAGTMVPVEDFVWDYDSWNEPAANDGGGPVNWSSDNKPDGVPVVMKDGPRTRKELFDIDQVWTMKQAMQYGVRNFYAAMWEAPYWMSNSSNTPSKIIRADTAPDGKKIYYQAYADYLVNYIKGFWEQWGIPITYINPFNEPDLAGASAAYIQEVIDGYIGPTLEKALEPGGALDGIKDPDGKVIDFVPQLAAPEGTNIGATLSRGATVLQELDPDTGKHKYIDVVSTHLYGTVGIGTNETTLKHTGSAGNDLALVPYDYTKDGSKWPAYLNGYKIWQTEFMNQDTGDSSSGAYTNRYGNQNINDAVRYAYLMTNMFTSNPGFNGYTWWSAWDSNGADGSDLIRFVHNGAQQNPGHVGTLTGEYRAFKRLYGFGHFSRFMHPGDLRFDVTREPAANLNIVGFKSADNKDFSITVTNANNDDSIQPLEFTLNDFPVGTKSVTVFRTSGSENQKKLAAIPVTDGKFVIDIPSASIVTIVPSEGTYATYNGLDSDRDIFSTLEAEGNDNLVAGNAAGSAGRDNEAVLLGDRDYLAYKNVNFADGSANGGIVRRHLLYLTAQSRAAAGSGGSLLAYVLPVGTPVNSVDDILAQGTRAAEILVPGNSAYGKYEAMVDTGDQSAYGHKDLYIVAATGRSGDTIAVDRFLFGADDSDWSTAANNSVVTIPGNVLSNGDFDTATDASISGWSSGRWNIGDLFEQNVAEPVLTADTMQNYYGLSRYLKNSRTSTSAGSAKIANRITAADRYDGMWQDVTGKMTKGERYRFNGQFLSMQSGPLGYDVAAEYPGVVEAALVYYDAEGNQLGYTPVGERDMPEPLASRAAGERAWFNGNTLVGSILEGGPLNISSFQPIDVRVANWAEASGDAFTYDEPSGTAKVVFALHAKDDKILYADGLSIVPAPDRDALRDALRAYTGTDSTLIGAVQVALTDSGLTQAQVSQLIAEVNAEPEEEPEQRTVDGVHVYDTSNGDVWSGANIILGNDANAWPWSKAGADGKVAFTPEKDATYRISFNYTSRGTNAIRVRWIKDDTNGGYTADDGRDQGLYLYSADQVATTIPAYFNSGMVNSGSYTLVTEVKFDGTQLAEGLIGNIAIRGGGGGNAFSINWIKVEKIGTDGASDQLLVDWPKHESPSDELSATLTGPGSVMPGESFDVVFGLINVAQAVYAQGIVVNFDASKLVLQDVQSLKDGVEILGQEEVEPGQVHIITYSQGEPNAVSTSGDLIQLQFKALDATGPIASSVYLTDVQVSDGDGTITNVNGGAVYNVMIGSAAAVDKTALTGAINSASASLSDASEGTLWGQYVVGSKATMQAAIASAQGKASDSAATQEQVDQAVAQLNAALQAFTGAINTHATIGDLGIMAKHYNSTSDSPDWGLYKRYDINHDNRINITDLAYIAGLVLNN